MQVDQELRVASQARVLQLLWSGSEAVTTGASPGYEREPASQASHIKHLGQPPHAADWAPGGIWGLGTSRTMQWFEDSCGVKFKKKLIEQRALFGGQDPGVFVML